MVYQRIFCGNGSYASHALTADGLAHLRRCVELAREGLDAGDEPFGSLLVDASGRPRFEDCNRVAGGDADNQPKPL